MSRPQVFAAERKAVEELEEERKGIDALGGHRVFENGVDNLNRTGYVRWLVGILGLLGTRTDNFMAYLGAWMGEWRGVQNSRWPFGFVLLSTVVRRISGRRLTVGQNQPVIEGWPLIRYILRVVSWILRPLGSKHSSLSTAFHHAQLTKTAPSIPTHQSYLTTAIKNPS